MTGREMRRRETVNYSRVEQEKGSATPVWLSSKNRRATTAGAFNRRQSGDNKRTTKVSEAEPRHTHVDVQVTKPSKQRKSSIQSREKSIAAPAPARHAARAIAADEGTHAERPNVKYGKRSKSVKVVNLEPEIVCAIGAAHESGPAPAAVPPPHKPGRRSASSPAGAVAAAKAESFQQVTGRKRATKVMSEESGQDAHKRRRSDPKSDATQSGAFHRSCETI